MSARLSNSVTFLLGIIHGANKKRWNTHTSTKLIYWLLVQAFKVILVLPVLGSRDRSVREFIRDPGGKNRSMPNAYSSVSTSINALYSDMETNPK